jgi:hypothetical protein
MLSQAWREVLRKASGVPPPPHAQPVPDLKSLEAAPASLGDAIASFLSDFYQVRGAVASFPGFPLIHTDRRPVSQ